MYGSTQDAIDRLPILLHARGVHELACRYAKPDCRLSRADLMAIGCFPTQVPMRAAFSFLLFTRRMTIEFSDEVTLFTCSDWDLVISRNADGSVAIAYSLTGVRAHQVTRKMEWIAGFVKLLEEAFQ